jgi:hypothetical protein
MFLATPFYYASVALHIVSAVMWLICLWIMVGNLKDAMGVIRGDLERRASND